MSFRTRTHLRECLRLSRRQVDDPVADHSIERCIVAGKRFDVCLDVHYVSRGTAIAKALGSMLNWLLKACGVNTVAKLMRQAQIMPKMIRRFRAKTNSRHTKASPSLVGRVFQVDRPNSCWVSDVTYIPTREGWLLAHRKREKGKGQRLALTLSAHQRAEARKSGPCYVDQTPCRLISIA